MNGETFIIAEAGVNHNGDPALARRLVEEAARIGADAVKFQSFKAEAVVTGTAKKAAYQEKLTGGVESQFEMLRRLELSPQMHRELADLCAARGIEFMSTPFDSDSASFLRHEIGVRRIKIPSGEITNGPFLLDVASSQVPIVLSTGMSTLAEVEAALAVIAHGLLGRQGMPDRTAYQSAGGKTRLQEQVTLLHCTSEYPAPYADTNLRAMQTMKDAFGLETGLSDHTPDIFMPIAAVAMGARMIEKHVTLDRTLPGPDHAASLEVEAFAHMVAGIRAAECALGSGEKRPAAAEMGNIPVVRRSLVAGRAICRGEAFSEDNVAAKRPAGGLAHGILAAARARGATGLRAGRIDRWFRGAVIGRDPTERQRAAVTAYACASPS